MCDAAIATNFTPYISVATALIGGYAGYRVSLANIKRQEHNKAAAEFMCAFTDELRLIADSCRDTNFENIFNEAYIRHYNALIRFQPYLSESARTEIEKAWKEHCKDYYPDAEKDGFTGGKSISRFMHYEHKQTQKGNYDNLQINEEHEVTFERAKQLARKNLERILSFAKFK